MGFIYLHEIKQRNLVAIALSGMGRRSRGQMMVVI
jgi:hypothetical protein